MTAFVVFIRSYAIWLYLLCAVGILVGLKILTDARRLARTSLFSIDQERAGERTARALLLILIFLSGTGAVTAVNTLIGPAAPIPEPAILRGATPTLSALVFPTSTAFPSTTPTLIRPTETPFVTAAPASVTPTRLTARPSVAPTAATGAPVFSLPAPKLVAPPNGNVFVGLGQANAAMTLKWDWSCTGCALGPQDRYVVVITFVDKVTGLPKPVGGGPRDNFLTMADIVRGTSFDIWHQAKDDAFQWYVQVKRGETPLTAPSETWKFIWH